jgi:hypothetical protein
MMHLYPERTENRNVPADVFIVAETEAMSGEIVTTYYADLEGNIWQCGDWVIDKSRPATMHNLCKLTWDTEQMIAGRWQSWKEGQHGS